MTTPEEQLRFDARLGIIETWREEMMRIGVSDLPNDLYGRSGRTGDHGDIGQIRSDMRSLRDDMRGIRRQQWAIILGLILALLGAIVDLLVRLPHP